jgi:antitoxin component YwqK of YwqJK toxin-antitoxin module
MRIILATVFFSFISVTCLSQKDSVRKYLDAELHFSSRKDAVYGAIAVKKNDHWVLYAVYPDTSILLKVVFKDADLSIKDGQFTLYHQKGIIAQDGYFTDNVPDGVWQSWYINRALKDSGDIVNNHLAGVWKHWYENGQLKSREEYKNSVIDANPDTSPAAHDNSNLIKYNKGILDGLQPAGILEGTIATWYENGNKESVLSYRNDSLAGLCSFFRGDGSLSSKETYANGKVVDLACYNEKAEYSGATCSVLKPPVLIHPFFTAKEYVVDQLHRNNNRDIKEEGEAVIRFTITKTGKLADLIIVSSPDPALTNHIKKIFSAMPAWSPAISHNRPVDYSMELDIPFYRGRDD